MEITYVCSSVLYLPWCGAEETKHTSQHHVQLQDANVCNADSFSDLTAWNQLEQNGVHCMICQNNYQKYDVRTLHWDTTSIFEKDRNCHTVWKTQICYYYYSYYLLLKELTLYKSKLNLSIQLNTVKFHPGISHVKLQHIVHLIELQVFRRPGIRAFDSAFDAVSAGIVLDFAMGMENEWTKCCNVLYIYGGLISMMMLMDNYLMIITIPWKSMDIMHIYI